jgi:hypothetical protein
MADELQAYRVQTNNISLDILHHQYKQIWSQMLIKSVLDSSLSKLLSSSDAHKSQGRDMNEIRKIRLSPRYAVAFSSMNP